jgi:hypothetical protein
MAAALLSRAAAHRLTAPVRHAASRHASASSLSSSSASPFAPLRSIAAISAATAAALGAALLYGTEEYVRQSIIVVVFIAVMCDVRCA